MVGYLVVLAIGVFRDVLGFLELRLQERDALVVRQAAALQRLAVPAHRSGVVVSGVRR